MALREPTGTGRRGGLGVGAAGLTGVVVAAIAVAALILRPDGGFLGRGRGPLGAHTPVVLGLALVALVAGLTLYGRVQRGPADERRLGPAEQRLADVTEYVLRIAPFAVPAALFLLHRFGALRGRGGHGKVPRPIFTSGPRPLPTPSVHPRPHRGSVHHFGLFHVLLTIGLGLLALAVLVAAVLVWRALRARSRQAPAPGTPFEDDDERELLAQAVDSGRRALLGGRDARAAVIACYAAMEESLAASGVVRHASDSPQDLLERAVADGLPAQGAATELTALFREARYSRHPMDDGHRDRAAAALAEIADRLAALAPPEADGTGADDTGAAGAGAAGPGDGSPPPSPSTSTPPSTSPLTSSPAPGRPAHEDPAAPPQDPPAGPAARQEGDPR